MRMTLGGWLSGALLFAFGFAAGKFSNSLHSDGQLSHQSLIHLNEDAGLLRVGEKTIRLGDLQASDRFGLQRILEQFVTQAQRYAEGRATLLSLVGEGKSSADWRSVLAEQISMENLKKVYSENANFKQSGAFIDVWPDVERFILERERNKKVGEFLEKKYSLNQLEFIQTDLPFPELPFDVSMYPKVIFGEQFKDESPEVAVFFRYGGRLSRGVFTLIADLSREQNKKIPVRLIPEPNDSVYDTFAIDALFQAQKAASEKPTLVREVHKLLLTEPLNPSGSRPPTEEGLVPLLKEKFRTQGLVLQVTSARPENLPAIAAWVRDIRMNRQPQIFVAGQFVSESSPRGLPDALRMALGMKSIVGR